MMEEKKTRRQFSQEFKVETAEIVIIPGEQHATDILETHPNLAERIAVWLASSLGVE